MAKLPTDLSGREVRAALERAGFVFRRQTGSHMILRRDAPYDAVDKKLQVLCSLERAAKRYNPKRVDENAR